MSRRWQIACIVLGLLVAVGLLFGGYKYGLKQCKPCPQPVPAVQKEVAKKPQQKVVKKQVAKQAAPIVKQVAPPPVVAVAPPAADCGAYVSAPVPARLFTLRLNVVEWSDTFSGDLFSRRLGPAIRKGMADGSIKQASAPIIFRVEWRQGAERLAGKTIWINGESRVLPLNFSSHYPVVVATRNGKATIEMDPTLIGPETVLFVWPHNAPRLASPPRNSIGEQLPLITTPGELDCRIKNGAEVYMHFILAPAPTVSFFTTGKE